MSDTVRSTNPDPDPEIVDDDDREVAAALALRHPAVPITLQDLAALGRGALEILDARIAILETARKKAIRMMHPEDVILFKSPDERITGYVQDAGCERARDILGVEIYNVGDPVRINSPDGQSFMYIITGDGRSRLTQQHVERMEGGRSSTEDFCKDATGAHLELLVRKAARANLDGNIARELMGLKAVPLDEFKAAWEGTSKTIDHCRKGRGFGSGAERLGATREGVPDVPPPTCPVCPPVNGVAVALKYRAAKGNRAAFFGCPNYDKHPRGSKPVIVDAAEWIAKSTADAARHADAARDENNRLDAEIAKAEGGGDGNR